MRHTLGPDTWKALGGGARMQGSADIRRGIVFFGLDDPPKYGGTGFLLAYKKTAWLVTARHVAKGLRDAPFWIRASERGPHSMDVSDSDWDDHPDVNVDVSVMLLHIWGPDIDYCPEDALLTRHRRLSFGLELGNFVYTIGLFARLPGENGAMSVVHTGFIARLPEDDGPIKTKVGNCEAYLVQSQHLGGLSGSPVFVRRTHVLFERDDDQAVAAGEIALMGLWSGGFYGQPVDDYEMPGAQVPIGFGVVIPAERIIEAMDHVIKTKKPKNPDDAYLAKGDSAFQVEPSKGDDVLKRMLSTPPKNSGG